MVSSITPLLPADGAARLEFNMYQVHHIIKSGHDTIMFNLNNPPRDDLENFLGYCEAWADVIETHHDIQQQLVFPLLKEKLEFSNQEAQNVFIDAELDSLLVYIRAIRTDPSLFNPLALRVAMSTFKSTLYAHLDGELAHIAPTPTLIGVFDDASLRKLRSDVNEYAQSRGDPHLIVPFLMGHTRPELQSTWPDLPWLPSRKADLALKHTGYWKYAPYTIA